jgi:hypothetical protein
LARIGNLGQEESVTSNHRKSARARTGTTATRGVRRATALIAALTLALLALAATAGGASAHGTVVPKKVLVSIAPVTVPSGSTHVSTASLTNKASSGKLDSANVTAPTGFVITSASIGATSSSTSSYINPLPLPTATVVPPNVIQLRNLGLKPGKTLTVNFAAIAPCSAGAFTWSVVATGFTADAASALSGTFSGSCALDFNPAQPTSAARGTTVTTVAFTPEAPPVQVRVLDATGAIIVGSAVPVTLALSPAAPFSGGEANASGGIATFPALTVNGNGTYTLAATSSANIAPATSNPFTISDAGANCATSECSATADGPGQNQKSTVSASSTTGVIFVSVADDGLDCGDSWIFNHAPSTTTVDQSGITGIKTATVTIDKSFVNRSIKSRFVLLYRVCFASPTPFVDRLGNTVTQGLLPRCRSWDDFLYPPDYRRVTVPPCVDSIVKTPSGDIVETLKLPAADPRFR